MTSGLAPHRLDGVNGGAGHAGRADERVGEPRGVEGGGLRSHGDRVSRRDDKGKGSS